MMRKVTAVILAAVLAFSLTACSSGEAETTMDPTTVSSPQTEEATTEPATSASSTESSEEASQTEASAGSNILVAYFSVPETDGADTVAGASRIVSEGEVLGNCQYVAQLISQEVGGELFRIETVQEYPGSHDPLLEFAYNERAEDARPGRLLLKR